MGALPNKLRSGTEGGPLLNGNAAADAQQEAKIATEVPRSETFAGLTARDKKYAHSLPWFTTMNFIIVLAQPWTN